MRAVTYNRQGGPDVIEIVDLPEPTPGEGEVLVRVQAATINPADVGIMTGAYGPIGDYAHYPATPGWDLAGTVEAIGAGVETDLLGAYVLGYSQWMGTGVGTQAELVVLPAVNVVLADRSIAPPELATVALNGLTAIRGLDLAEVTEGTTVLVTGAVGGVGGFAVELATHRGARVLALAAAKDRETVLGFGATDLIDREGDVAAQVRAVLPDGVDAVIDAAPVGDSIDVVLRDGGRFASVRDGGQHERGITGKRIGVRPNHEQLVFLAELAGWGKLALRVAKTYPVEQAADAYRDFIAGGNRGRIVITF
jgi:NADPH:quinone reductase-like Zn-dependent oxidoreductase